jgi:hypothetical protein
VAKAVRGLTNICIFIRVVDNPDQAPLRPGPRDPSPSRYSRTWITIRPVATMMRSGFREGGLSETRACWVLQAHSSGFAQQLG